MAGMSVLHQINIVSTLYIMLFLSIDVLELKHLRNMMVRFLGRDLWQKNILLVVGRRLAALKI